jgi:poly(3-hydroxybutyrate) depolymerase
MRPFGACKGEPKSPSRTIIDRPRLADATRDVVDATVMRCCLHPTTNDPAAGNDTPFGPRRGGSESQIRSRRDAVVLVDEAAEQVASANSVRANRDQDLNRGFS